MSNRSDSALRLDVVQPKAHAGKVTKWQLYECVADSASRRWKWNQMLPLNIFYSRPLQDCRTRTSLQTLVRSCLKRVIRCLNWLSTVGDNGSEGGVLCETARGRETLISRAPAWLHLLRKERGGLQFQPVALRRISLDLHPMRRHTMH